MLSPRVGGEGGGRGWRRDETGLAAVEVVHAATAGTIPSFAPASTSGWGPPTVTPSTTPPTAADGTAPPTVSGTESPGETVPLAAAPSPAGLSSPAESGENADAMDM